MNVDDGGGDHLNEKEVGKLINVFVCSFVEV
jgi:hypothetical protein